MSVVYNDSKGSHVKSNEYGICGHCNHDIGDHYFLDNAEFAHCNDGFISHCKCSKLRKKNWTKPKKYIPEVHYESS